MSSKVSCKSSTFSFANGSKLRSLESDFSEACPETKLSRDSFFENMSEDSFYDDSPDGFERDPKRRTTILGRARNGLGKGIGRGFAVLSANNRIMKRIEWKTEQKVLQDWYFKVIRITSKLMWRSWWLILVLLIFSQELVTSWSPMINFVNRGLYGRKNSYNQSQVNIYSNVNPNCWTAFIEDDISTELWSTADKRETLSALKTDFNIEFPNQFIAKTEFESAKFKPTAWLKKNTDYQVFYWLQMVHFYDNIYHTKSTPISKNSTYRVFPRDKFQLDISDHVASQYLGYLAGCGHLIQFGLMCLYHWITFCLPHVNVKYETQSLPMLLTDLVLFAHPMFFLARLIRVWWIHSRITFRTYNLTKRIILEAQDEVLKTFWLKNMFRNASFKFITKLFLTVMLIVTWIVWVYERQAGFCGSWAKQTWIVSGSMSGAMKSNIIVSRDLIFNDSILGLIYVMTVIFGIGLMAFIISMVMNFIQSLQRMGAGELEIEKIRHQEILEVSAGRLILATYRRYLIKKEISDVILLNNELVKEQNEIENHEYKSSSKAGIIEEDELLEEKQISIYDRVSLIGEHLVFLQEQTTRLRCGKKYKKYLERKEKEAEKMKKLHQQNGQSIEEDLSLQKILSVFSGQENIERRMSLSTTNLLKNKIEARKMSMVSLTNGVVRAKKAVTGARSAIDRSGSITSISSVMKRKESIILETITNPAAIMSKQKQLKFFISPNKKTNNLESKIEAIIMKVEEAFKLKINQWQAARVFETRQLVVIEDDINQANSAGSTQLMMGELRKVTKNVVRLEEDMKIIKHQNQRLLDILNEKFEI